MLGMTFSSNMMLGETLRFTGIRYFSESRFSCWTACSAAMCDRGRFRVSIYPWLDFAPFAAYASYPYYSIPPQLYEHLPECLGKWAGCVRPAHSWSAVYRRILPGPPTIENKTSRVHHCKHRL